MAGSIPRTSRQRRTQDASVRRDHLVIDTHVTIADAVAQVLHFASTTRDPHTARGLRNVAFLLNTKREQLRSEAVRLSRDVLLLVDLKEVA